MDGTAAGPGKAPRGIEGNQRVERKESAWMDLDESDGREGGGSTCLMIGINGTQPEHAVSVISLGLTLKHIGIIG
jgi:hypothetical protein